ncbi:MAG: hypothetical protein KC435_11430 [Thermomicrobiales bacterium]|nr:hypothetical protein [Thermomicrobiales bacterium]
MKKFNSILSLVVLLGMLLQPVASAQSDATPAAEETNVSTTSVEVTDSDTSTPEETSVATESPTSVPEESSETSTPDTEITTPTAEETNTGSDTQDEDSLSTDTPDQAALAGETGTVLFNVTLPAQDPDGKITIEIMGQNVDYYDWDVLVSTGTTIVLPVGTYSFSWYGEGYTYNGDIFTITANTTTNVSFTPQANGNVTFTVNLPSNVPDARIRIIISATQGGEAYDSFDSDGSYPVTFTLPVGTWYWRTSALALTNGGSGSFNLLFNDALAYTASPVVSGSAFAVTVDVNPSPSIDLTGQIACIYPTATGTYWARRCITLAANGTGSFGPLTSGSYIVALNENGLYAQLETTVSVTQASANIVIPWNRTQGGSITFTPNFPDGMYYAFILIEKSDGGYAQGGNRYLWSDTPVVVELPAGNYRYGLMDPYAVTPEYVYFTVTDGFTQNVTVSGVDVTLNIADDRGGGVSDFSACVMGREYGYSQCTTLGKDGSFHVGLMTPGSYQVVLSGGDSVHPDATVTLNVTSAQTYSLVWPTPAVSVALSPTTGQAGTTTTVTGTGFAPNDLITIRWGGSAGVVLRQVSADNSGNLSTTVTIPVTAAKQSYVIAVSGASGGSSTATYTVNQLAQVTVTLNPTSGRAGTTTKVSGSGFQPNELVTIRWNSASGTSLGTVTAGTDGTFANKDVTIPSTANNQTFTIWATAPSGQQGSASYTVNQLSSVSVTLSPTSGQAGTTTKVSGSGFQPNELVTIRWNSASGTSLGTVSAGADGTFANKDVTIPVTASKQTYAIWATANSGQQGSASYTVNQLAAVTITLSPTSGQAGTTTKVSGAGFQPNETVTIRWNSASGTSLGTITAGTDGTFANKDVTIPVTASKQTFAIWATAPSGQQGSASYTVNQLAAVSVTVNPTSGQAGTTTKVSGSGFQPNETVTIRWNSASGTSLGTVTAGADGTFANKDVTIPVTASKQTFTIWATAPSGQQGSASYTVNQLVAVSLVLNPASGKAGTTTTLAGSGFQPGETVTIRWGGSSGAVLRTVSAGTDGRFSVSITVPVTSAVQSYAVYVSAPSGQVGSTSFAVTQLADVSVSPSSSQGQAGKSYTLSGEGFLPGQQVTVRWDSATGTQLAVLTPTSTGSINGSITIPAIAIKGTYTLYVASTSGQATTTSFTVNQLAEVSITLSISSGKAGTTTNIAGSGFQPGELITIRWGGSSGTVLRSFNAGTTGKFTANTTIPISAQLGQYEIYVSAVSGQSGSAIYTVTQLAGPVLELNPASGAAGSRTTMTGSGFTPGELITIRWGGSSGTILRTFNAGTTGKFSAGLTIPVTASKQSYVVYVSSASGKTGSATYTVNQVVGVEIALSPASGAAGSRITVTGSGFNPGEQITLRWGGSSGSVLRTFNAGTTGKFSAGVTIPASASIQSYVIYVSSASGKTGSATFAVTALALVPIWLSESLAYTA